MGREAWVELEEARMGDIWEDEVEIRGWERGSSSSSWRIWRRARLRLRTGGALCDGRRSIVDSTWPTCAKGSSALCQMSKVSPMVELRISGDFLFIWRKSAIPLPVLY